KEGLATARDAGGPCHPVDMSSFQPVFKPPQTFYRDVCKTDQITTLAHCISVGQTTTCNNYIADAANRACVECAFTNPAPATLGAVVAYRGWVVEVNSADCFANAEGDLTADGCGAKIQARRACTVAACAGCSVETPDEAAAEEACALAAEDTVCKLYTDR